MSLYVGKLFALLKVLNLWPVYIDCSRSIETRSPTAHELAQHAAVYLAQQSGIPFQYSFGLDGEKGGVWSYQLHEELYGPTREREKETEYVSGGAVKCPNTFALLRWWLACPEQCSGGFSAWAITVALVHYAVADATRKHQEATLQYVEQCCSHYCENLHISHKLIRQAWSLVGPQRYNII